MKNQLLRRKPVETFEAEIKASGLKRSLGKWGLTSIGVGAIIAAGLFVMSGLGIVVNLAMMFSLGFHNWVRLFAWLALGIAIYFFYGRKHSKLNKSVSAENATKPVIPA